MLISTTRYLFSDSGTQCEENHQLSTYETNLNLFRTENVVKIYFGNSLLTLVSMHCSKDVLENRYQHHVYLLAFFFWECNDSFPPYFLDSGSVLG